MLMIHNLCNIRCWNSLCWCCSAYCLSPALLTEYAVVVDRVHVVDVVAGDTSGATAEVIWRSPAWCVTHSVESWQHACHCVWSRGQLGGCHLEHRGTLPHYYDLLSRTIDQGRGLGSPPEFRFWPWVEVRDSDSGPCLFYLDFSVILLQYVSLLCHLFYNWSSVLHDCAPFIRRI